MSIVPSLLFLSLLAAPCPAKLLFPVRESQICSQHSLDYGSSTYLVTDPDNCGKFYSCQRKYNGALRTNRNDSKWIWIAYQMDCPLGTFFDGFSCQDGPGCKEEKRLTFDQTVSPGPSSYLGDIGETTTISVLNENPNILIEDRDDKVESLNFQIENTGSTLENETILIENSSVQVENTTSTNEKTASPNENTTSPNENTASPNEHTTSPNERTTSPNEDTIFQNEDATMMVGNATYYLDATPFPDRNTQFQDEYTTVTDEGASIFQIKVEPKVVDIELTTTPVKIAIERKDPEQKFEKYIKLISRKIEYSKNEPKMFEKTIQDIEIKPSRSTTTKKENQKRYPINSVYETAGLETSFDKYINLVSSKIYQYR